MALEKIMLLAIAIVVIGLLVAFGSDLVGSFFGEESTSGQQIINELQRKTSPGKL